MKHRTPRIGIFGWGVVAPKCPDIDAFAQKLEEEGSWLEPFEGFGPANFLVGRPEFDFFAYKEWIDARFEPRKFPQLDAKMGNPVKYAIGAFIQALGQNPGLESVLQELGTEAHIYVGTGLGDLPTQYEVSVHHYQAQRRWNRFWCREERNRPLAEYRAASPEERARLHQELGVPTDPEEADRDAPHFDDLADYWYAFWVEHSEDLAEYLEKIREIEEVSIDGDIESSKGGWIRRKVGARRRLNKEYGCPDEPWTSVDARVLWNISNIPAAQISMLGRITGPAIAPVAACSGFGAALRIAINAIRLGQAKVAVVGMTDPEPHVLSVGGFFDARVISHDGQVSKPFAGLRGTHVAGGSCIWIIGDVDELTSRGLEPVGLEIMSVALTSDADHIITPSTDGPRTAILAALAEADAEPREVATWDMHATATPGDWMELMNTLSVLPDEVALTARKGTFGHGMSVCGGWELTAQHLGVARGRLYPVNLDSDELHPSIAAHGDPIVMAETTPIEGGVAGKINMGIGGINSCVICRRWDDS